jgi:hypothetical protein
MGSQRPWQIVVRISVGERWSADSAAGLEVKTARMQARLLSLAVGSR